MPIIRDTHKWKPRQKFCSLTEESKEVGEQSVVCSENKHGLHLPETVNFK